MLSNCAYGCIAPSSPRSPSLCGVETRSNPFFTQIFPRFSYIVPLYRLSRLNYRSSEFLLIDKIPKLVDHEVAINGVLKSVEIA